MPNGRGRPLRLPVTTRTRRAGSPSVEDPAGSGADSVDRDPPLVLHVRAGQVECVRSPEVRAFHASLCCPARRFISTLPSHAAGFSYGGHHSRRSLAGMSSGRARRQISSAASNSRLTGSAYSGGTSVPGQVCPPPKTVHVTTRVPPGACLRGVPARQFGRVRLAGAGRTPVDRAPSRGGLVQGEHPSAEFPVGS